MKTIREKYTEDSDLTDIYDKFDAEWRSLNDEEQKNMTVGYEKHRESFDKLFD